MLYALSNKNYFLLISFSVMITLLLLEQLFLFIPILIIISFAYNKPKSSLIILSFVALITLTSGLGEGQRLVVQIGAMASLFLFFIKNYGFDFKNYPKVPVQILYLISSIIFTIVFALLFTDYLSLGIDQLTRSLLFFFIIYLFYSLLSDYNDIKYFLYALFIGALFYFIIIFYEVVRADFDIINLNQNLILNEGSTFIHRNAIGGFFSICISVTVAFLAVLDSNKKNKKYLLIFIFLLISGLVLTNSRGAIISLVLGTVYIFYSVNRKALKYFILSILIVLPVIFIDEISESINLYLRLEQISTGRDYIFQTAANIISNNPIIGAGPAATKFEIYNYLPYMLGTPEEFFLSKHINSIGFGQAHNFYLFLYTDLGILGLLVSLLIPYTFFNLSHRLIKEVKEKNNFLYSLLVGVQAAGIALFIRGMFEWAGIFSYGTLTFDLPFWWLFIIIGFLYLKIIINKQSIPFL